MALSNHRVFSSLGPRSLTRLPITGVAHTHWSAPDLEWILRLPNSPRPGLSRSATLDYEAACFRRAAASGHTPALLEVLPPQPDLPGGALRVQKIRGRYPALPQDLGLLAQALAAIHALPLPPSKKRPPIPAPPAPLAATLTLVEQQAESLSMVDLPAETARRIQQQIGLIRHEIEILEPADSLASPVCLVVTDAHPGNFMIDCHGKAMFLDLERMLYGNPALDVAHCVLPSSTGWYPEVTGIVTPKAAAQFEEAYRKWRGLDAWELSRLIFPARRLAWLRSITFFVKRLALQTQSQDPMPMPVPIPDPAIEAHFKAHIAQCLTPAMVVEVVEKWLSTGVNSA